MALTDQVLMPGSDYQAICDATRTLTGETGTLKSGDIATKLNDLPILLFNETLTLPTTDTTYAVSFKVHSGEESTGMTISSDGNVLIFEGIGEVYVAGQGWVMGDVFRRITLLSTPTEEFLTWFNANITKHATPLLVSGERNVTVNGVNEIIIPPEPYDGQGRINVTVSYENPTFALSMASGNQIINTKYNAFMKKVTVIKPSTLIAPNIKKNVDIGGVVGTYEGSGSGGSYITVSTTAPTSSDGSDGDVWVVASNA